MHLQILSELEKEAAISPEYYVNKRQYILIKNRRVAYEKVAKNYNT